MYRLKNTIFLRTFALFFHFPRLLTNGLQIVLGILPVMDPPVLLSEEVSFFFVLIQQCPFLSLQHGERRTQHHFFVGGPVVPVDAVSGYFMSVSEDRQVAGYSQVQVVILTGVYGGIEMKAEKKFPAVEHGSFHSYIITLQQGTVVISGPYDGFISGQIIALVVDPVMRSGYSPK
jgi:hypothetical protein